MTPTTIFTTALARRGDHSPTVTQTDRARVYFNIAKTEVETLTDWRWMYKTSTITTVASTRSYSLASDVLVPLHYWDTTNDKIMKFRNPEDVTEADPDEDETGEGVIVSITGTNSTTGYWDVDVYPTPDTSSETIKYRYRGTVADFTSGDDDTDLLPKYPPIIQNALLWATAGMLKDEREKASAADEWNKYTVSVSAALKLNGQINIPARVVMNSVNSMRGLTMSLSITPD